MQASHYKKELFNIWSHYKIGRDALQGSGLSITGNVQAVDAF